jgi:UDP-N-acetyl-D-mannosaminuronate dehydrogenase
MEYYECVCIGTGEIGKPLYELINGSFKTLAIDPEHYPENNETKAVCFVMHVCIPGDLKHFEDIVLDYIDKYQSGIVYIHSTVRPGTCDFIQSEIGDEALIVSSPVHGKHHNNQMKKDMLRYPKYVGVPKLKNIDRDAVREHLELIGFADVRLVNGCENTEWLKVLSTTYFGLIIAWHQEIERICDHFGLLVDEVVDIFKYQDDIKPPHYSGVIGGHCVMPNIKIIKEIWQSDLLDWIEKSNEEKKLR